MATAKIVSLAIRTLSKPIANAIKTQAKQHPRFKKFCVNVAQTYHTVEESLKQRFFDYPKTAVRPLNEAGAVELGASFMSEALLFSVAGGTILLEAWRSSRKATSRVVSVDESLARLEAERLMDVESMGRIVDELKYIKAETESLRQGISGLADVMRVIMEDENERRRKEWFKWSGADATKSLIRSRLKEVQDAVEEAESTARVLDATQRSALAQAEASVIANAVEAGLVKP